MDTTSSETGNMIWDDAIERSNRLLVILQLERRDRMVSTNKPRWQSVPKAARTDAHKAMLLGSNTRNTKSPPGGEDEAIPVDGFGQVQEQSQPVAEKQKPPRPEQSPGPVPRLPIQESTEPPQAKPRPESTPGGTPPFSQYLHPEVLTISLTRPFSDTERAPKEDEDLDAVACREYLASDADFVTHFSLSSYAKYADWLHAVKMPYYQYNLFVSNRVLVIGNVASREYTFQVLDRYDRLSNWQAPKASGATTQTKRKWVQDPFKITVQTALARYATKHTATSDSGARLPTYLESSQYQLLQQYHRYLGFFCVVPSELEKSYDGPSTSRGLSKARACPMQ
ncbi:hypothetical protein BKA82DRAFT_4341126 [Pisolithus tinctorius]|nr:hypothetical protein BKA82DRAFT_4341126 [Pisolithus tinctorius]